ncbi:MAG: prepilin-type N-terminal cleavage/methylation domain-containing protein [Burkholderiales bacterium]|nr:prepilin-type N-terminal cleavage/methylation domain-containing protein [Burkholderiales bacterium]
MTLRHRSRGFSLVELAIGLVVAAVLLSSLLVPLLTQVDQRRVSETRRMLEESKEALIGFAIAYGRLPCPATGTTGVESIGTVAAGDCTVWDGFLPGTTLGLAFVDAQGFAIDAYGGQRNRIRYVIANPAIFPRAFTAAPTATAGMRGATIATLASAANNNNLLSICGSVPTGPTPPPNCSGVVALANGSAIAIIYSVGKNGFDPVQQANLNPANPLSAAEAINLNPDKAVIFAAPNNKPGEEFDDIVTWIGPAVLFGRMTAAGALP